MTDVVNVVPVTQPETTEGERRALRRQAWAVLAVLAVVCYADQVTKAWAWRHLHHVHVDSGSGVLASTELGGWFRDRAVGAVIDVVDATVLAAGLLLLARKRRSVPLLLSASVALAGWASNLADRLGTHYLTAPGSVRGAVDYLPIAGRSWNLADVAIGLGSIAFLGTICAGAVRARHPVRPSLVHRPFAAPRGRIAALVCLLVVAALAATGAIVWGTVSSPAEVFAAPPG